MRTFLDFLAGFRPPAANGEYQLFTPGRGTSDGSVLERRAAPFSLPGFHRKHRAEYEVISPAGMGSVVTNYLFCTVC
jgi:hypothetical protein